MTKYSIAGLVTGAFLFLGGSALADGITQVWDCELDDDATGEELMEVSKRWADAARKIDGASELEAYIEVPIVGDASAGDFYFVMSLPSATAWGQFEDGYEGSEAEAVDEDWAEVASCDGSTLMRSMSLQ